MKLHTPRGPVLGSIEKVQVQQERLRERYSQNENPLDETDIAPESGKRLYWYFSATVHEKGMLSRALSGVYSTEEEAMRVAEEVSAVDPEFFTYTTRDMRKAKGIFALEEAKRQEDLGAGMGRVAHQKTLERVSRRP